MENSKTQTEQIISAEDRVIASRLMLARARMELKRGELANLSGVSEENIAAYENATQVVPASDLFMLSIAMGISIEYFYSDAVVNVPTFQFKEEVVASI